MKARKPGPFVRGGITYARCHDADEGLSLVRRVEVEWMCSHHAVGIGQLAAWLTKAAAWCKEGK